MQNRKSTIVLCSSNILILIILGSSINLCNGHGRMIEPPSRASAWRYGFSTPANYNDHELFCGGFSRQWQRNAGKCGVCGDAFDQPEPRPNEFGGKWGLGVIVRTYIPESEISIKIELTASHYGFFEFRICPNVAPKQECLDENLLEIIDGWPSKPNPEDLKTRFYPRDGSRIYEIQAKLPKDLICKNCVLQWIYVAGNNWGVCENGTGAVGCGPQEQFRACADISIGETGTPPPFRPTRPGTKTTPKTKQTETTKKPTAPIHGTTEESEQGPMYMGIIIAIVALIVVLCSLAALYFYHYHGQRIKHLLRWQRTKNAKGTKKMVPLPVQTCLPPVPPPRTKRLSHHVQDIDASESSILTGTQDTAIKQQSGNGKIQSQSPECA